jgi:hypothetical protein
VSVQLNPKGEAEPEAAQRDQQQAEATAAADPEPDAAVKSVSQAVVDEAGTAAVFAAVPTTAPSDPPPVTPSSACATT